MVVGYILSDIIESNRNIQEEHFLVYGLRQIVSSMTNSIKKLRHSVLPRLLKKNDSVPVLHKNSLLKRLEPKKTYISRLENGKADVQLTTLFRIFEGLGRRVRLYYFIISLKFIIRKKIFDILYPDSGDWFQFVI